MIRAAIAFVVGYVVWTAIFLGGSQAVVAFFTEEKRAFDAGGDFRATVPLLIYIGLSVVASIAAGLSTATIARTRKPVVWMSLALLVTGIGVQASVWNRMPVWYHLIFLALLVPVCMSAAHLRLEKVASNPRIEDHPEE